MFEYIVCICVCGAEVCACARVRLSVRACVCGFSFCVVGGGGDETCTRAKSRRARVRTKQFATGVNSICMDRVCARAHIASYTQIPRLRHRVSVYQSVVVVYVCARIVSFTKERSRHLLTLPPRRCIAPHVNAPRDLIGPDALTEGRLLYSHVSACVYWCSTPLCGRAQFARLYAWSNRSTHTQGVRLQTRAKWTSAAEHPVRPCHSCRSCSLLSLSCAAGSQDECIRVIYT